MGIFPSESDRLTKLRNKICLFCEGQFSFTAIAYCVFEPNTIFEHFFGFYNTICIVNGIIFHFLFEWQNENILKLIKNCEAFIKSRMYPLI